MAFFVWDFQIQHTELPVHVRSAQSVGAMGSTIGIAMMAGYVVVDSFTSNLEEPFVRHFVNVTCGNTSLLQESAKLLVGTESE